jgi:hypothetical protein
VITITLRIGFAVLAMVVVGLVIRSMARLSWEVDALIAVAAIVAFAYRFERDETSTPPVVDPGSGAD